MTRPQLWKEVSLVVLMTSLAFIRKSVRPDWDDLSGMAVGLALWHLLLALSIDVAMYYILRKRYQEAGIWNRAPQVEWGRGNKEYKIQQRYKNKTWFRMPGWKTGARDSYQKAKFHCFVLKVSCCLSVLACILYTLIVVCHFIGISRETFPEGFSSIVLPHFQLSMNKLFQLNLGRTHCKNLLFNFFSLTLISIHAILYIIFNKNTKLLSIGTVFMLDHKF